VLTRFFESLYNKVFVNIIVNNSSSEVYIEVCSKKGVLKHYQSSFETTTINNEMLEFITSYTKESPYYYITLLDTSKEQGVIPTCDKHHLSFYHDISTSEHKCAHKNWSYYTSKIDLYDIEKRYADIGMDMVFSPFIVLANFFKDKIDSHFAMYILITESALCVIIFEESQLLYGKYINMNYKQDNEESFLSDEIEEMDISLEDESIDLDDIDADDDIEDIDELEALDDLDDFADIEDLDSIKDIDEFSKNRDVEEEFFERDEVFSESTNDNFNEDYDRFTNIKNSLGNFYSDEKYESKFIENVYIADAVGVTNDLKRYLEEEMFLNVYVRHIDLNIELLELSKMEVKV